MALIGEVGIAQLLKHGEELCGDVVEITRGKDNTVVVLSDGLGSGVKAHILAKLTAKIASQMISNDIPIEDVVDTLIDTLPTCQVRNIAYSTFSIIRLYTDGVTYLVDFDGCPMLRIHDNKIEPIARNVSIVNNRKINEASFRMVAGETLIVVSDGVVQAGLGEMLPNGLGIDGLIDSLYRFVDLTDSVQAIANKVVNICKSYYQDRMGDDTTCVVMRLKEENRVVIMTGPPSNTIDDARIVDDFLKTEGVHIICGGTTAKIFAREMDQKIRYALPKTDKKIPPISYIEGVDLTTEGIITLSEVQRLLENHQSVPEVDGLKELYHYLLAADHITVLQGMAENPAIKEGLQLPLDLRNVVIDRLSQTLEKMGKVVDIKCY